MRELAATDVHVVCMVPCLDGHSVSKRKWQLQRSPALTNILAQVSRGLSYLIIGCTMSYGATESVDHGSAEGDGERGEGGSGACCFVFSGEDDEDVGLGVVVFRFFADLVVFVECLLSFCMRVCFFLFFFFFFLSVCWCASWVEASAFLLDDGSGSALSFLRNASRSVDCQELTSSMLSGVTADMSNLRSTRQFNLDVKWLRLRVMRNSASCKAKNSMQHQSGCNARHGQLLLCS